jgi:hypothetical protein
MLESERIWLLETATTGVLEYCPELFPHQAASMQKLR